MTATDAGRGERLTWPIDDVLAAAVLDALPDATAVLDATGTIIAVNQAWRMYAMSHGGSEASTGVGVNYVQVCVSSAGAGCVEAAQVATRVRAVLADLCMEAEMEYQCPSGSVHRWFLLRITRLTGSTSGAVVSHVDITRRKMAEDELAHAASHDPLSGLVNRTLLGLRLTTALAPRLGHRPRADVGVLYIDLDGFKSINDTYGHGAGDGVLLTVADRLRSLVRPGDTVGRLGGDEFVIISPRIDGAGLAALAARIERALNEPHLVRGRTLCVGGSVGAHLARAGDQAAHALDHADRAMYSLKHARRAGTG